MAGERQTEPHQAEGVIYDCPHAEVCKTCPCSHEDDACFPGERLRAEVARLRAERDHFHHQLRECKEWEAQAKVRAEAAEAEAERLRRVLLMIAYDTALSAETHRLMAQDVLRDFREASDGD